MRASPRSRRFAGAALLAGGLALTAACAPAQDDENAPPAAPQTLDRALRDAAAASPDSIVGVLLKVSGPLGAAELVALDTAGLELGTVAGDVLTGRIAAGDAARLAELDFVLHVELAKSIPLDSLS